VHRIEQLDADRAAAHLDNLAEVLADCVAGGASVNFMWPYGVDDARAWWQGQLAGLAAPDRHLFVAFDDGRAVGCVLLGRDAPPNQAHRGEVRKLLVHPSARGRGLGKALMAGLEAHARALGLELLTLDTGVGGEAETLYARLGWTSAGVIPNFAKWPDGRPCDTRYYFKPLGDPAA